MSPRLWALWLCPPVRVLPGHCATGVPPPSALSAPGVHTLQCSMPAAFCNSAFAVTIRPPCLAAPLLRFILSLVHRLTLLPALLNQRSRSPPALGSPQAQSQVRCGARNEPTLWCASWGLTADKVLSATVPGQSARPDDLPYDRQTDKHRSCQLTTRETRPRPSSASSAAPWLGFRPV